MNLREPLVSFPVDWDYRWANHLVCNTSPPQSPCSVGVLGAPGLFVALHAFFHSVKSWFFTLAKIHFTNGKQDEAAKMDHYKCTKARLARPIGPCCWLEVLQLEVLASPYQTGAHPGKGHG